MSACTCTYVKMAAIVGTFVHVHMYMYLAASTVHVECIVHVY